MQKTILAVIAASLLVTVFYACSNPAATKTPAVAEDPVKRGEYLVTIMGCDDCHSPKKMGPHGPEIIAERRFSGFPADFTPPQLDSNATKNGWVSLWADLTSAVGPWGQTFAANITSDTTGIGTWTEAQFKKAFTEGKYKGLDNTRPLMPHMPWQNYRNIKEEDVKAIFAFLKSTKPVNNVVPAAKLNPPPPAKL
ncbi:MAG: diheme cytochrome c-553 [Ferruginibacter sp.]